ncbi:MAG: 50S ribosome-binding GTPase, partial [Rickettsiales bacterium]|nr:50S ribosome-binding GTPase [Rickettsiales bacterium]
MAIVGRSSVGKSTLFNRLCGQSLAIVSSVSGVTRDRKKAIGRLGPMDFYLIDTAGWNNEVSKTKLEHRMMEQTEKAIGEADVCLFMVDGRAGVTSL